MKPFITGTAAYGPFTDESDIDIVMHYSDSERLKKQLEDVGFEIREPNKIINPVYTGFEFDIAGRTFNVIEVVNGTEYADWYRATKRMSTKQPIQDRKKRIERFTYYRDVAPI